MDADGMVTPASHHLELHRQLVANGGEHIDPHELQVGPALTTQVECPQCVDGTATGGFQQDTCKEAELGLCEGCVEGCLL